MANKMKLKKRYVKLLMSVFKQNKINQTKLEKFVEAHRLNSKSPREKHYENLTIIVPCYNHSKYLKSTFNCIINQTVVPDEVIFADDASTDNSIDLIEEFISQNLKRNINFKLIKQRENVGQATNLNIAVEQAKNDLIMILNDDDYLMHDAVENTLKVFNSEEHDIYLLGSKAFFFSNELLLSNLKKKTTDHTISKKMNVHKYYPEQIFLLSHSKGIDMSHSAMSFLKVAWKDAGGYYGNKQKRVIIYTDRDFQVRVNALYPIGVIEDAPFSFWRANSSVDAGLFT